MMEKSGRGDGEVWRERVVTQRMQHWMKRRDEIVEQQTSGIGAGEISVEAKKSGCGVDWCLGSGGGAEEAIG